MSKVFRLVDVNGVQLPGTDLFTDRESAERAQVEFEVRVQSADVDWSDSPTGDLKVGDRVKLVQRRTGRFGVYAPLGTEGTVTGVSSDYDGDDLYSVMFDRLDEFGHPGSQIATREHLERVDSKRLRIGDRVKLVSKEHMMKGDASFGVYVPLGSRGSVIEVNPDEGDYRVEFDDECDQYVFSEHVEKV